MSEPKLFAVQEANELLPFLAPALVELREKWEAAEVAREKRERAAMSNGGAKGGEDDADLMNRVTELMERITAWGVQLRDLGSGLVDFPAVIEGQDAFLCWRLGEPDVSHWHPVTEGFGGRRSLEG